MAFATAAALVAGSSAGWNVEEGGGVDPPRTYRTFLLCACAAAMRLYMRRGVMPFPAPLLTVPSELNQVAKARMCETVSQSMSVMWKALPPG